MLKTAASALEPLAEPLAERLAEPVGEAAFRKALSHFASGVTVITTRDGRGGVHGMTATAFSSLSLRPPLVLVAVAKSSRCHRMVLAEKLFGINILAADQEAISKHFGGKPSADEDARFAELCNVPVLAEAMVRLSCRLEQAIEGGDHSIFIGHVQAVATEAGDPLLHFGGRYHRLDTDPLG